MRRNRLHLALLFLTSLLRLQRQSLHIHIASKGGFHGIDPSHPKHRFSMMLGKFHERQRFILYATSPLFAKAERESS